MSRLFFLLLAMLISWRQVFSREELRDIKPPLDYKTFFSFKTLLIVVAVLAGALLIYFLIKKFFYPKTKEVCLKPLAAHDIAYQALEELRAKQLPGSGMIKEYYIELGDIVRRYLEARFAVKAPEMTTEEFIDFMHSADCLNKEQKVLLREFLSACDLVKFARNIPASREIDESFHSAKRLVDQTKHIIDLNE